MRHPSYMLVLAALLWGGCAGLRCGAGTVERDGACVVDDPTHDPADGAVTGDGGPSATDGGIADGPTGGDASPPTMYTAYRMAGGAWCGTDSGNYYVFCLPGDDCVASATNQCSGSSDGTYEAYRDGVGPLCGTDGGNYYAFCKAVDTCLDAALRRCGTAGNGSYQGYRTGGGPICGSDTGNYNVFCKPGGACLNEATTLCH